jgi:non-heme chloroperoxidase
VDWRSFARMLPRLHGVIRVLVPTQRGHGDASRPEAGYRSRDFAADLAAFMDVLHVEAAVIGRRRANSV